MFGLARFDLTEITRKILLPELSPDPARPMTLIVRYAGPGNRDWESAQFKRSASKPKDETAPAGTPPTDPSPADPDALLAKTLETSATTRREFAEMFAGTSLVGFENVYDDADPPVPVPYSLDAALKLLEALQFHVWAIWRTRFLDYVTDVKNFRAASTADPVDLGKG